MSNAVRQTVTLPVWLIVVMIPVAGWVIQQWLGAADMDLDRRFEAIERQAEAGLAQAASANALARSNYELLRTLQERITVAETFLSALGEATTDQEDRIRSLEAWQRFVNSQPNGGPQ